MTSFWFALASCVVRAVTVAVRLEYISRSLSVAMARRANYLTVSFKGGMVGSGSRKIA